MSSSFLSSTGAVCQGIDCTRNILFQTVFTYRQLVLRNLCYPMIVKQMLRYAGACFV
nr:MAG TPA: hypothetical protein [Caudoviricetes sp.]